jgi:predicted P-loop ATPase
LGVIKIKENWEAKIEAFAAVKIQVDFRFVTPCSGVVRDINASEVYAAFIFRLKSRRSSLDF